VGFALPTSNTTYTPNQFFDVCLPNGSRGCVRLVALLIRKTLGWCDAHGRPQAEQFALSYADFEAAGISRSMVKPAVAEALKGRFIRCVLPPRSKGRGDAGLTALFELNWDERGQYQKDPKAFRGFFAGEGNRTYIPNQFFDRVVASESLAVVKAVGAVARFSIGFANKWGHRRTLARVSFTDIQRYTHIADRKTVSGAIRLSLAGNYLIRVEEGYFDPNGGRNSRTATYALRWLQSAADRTIGMKTPPGDRFESPTGIQIKETNNTSKQLADAADIFEKLKAEGFDDSATQAIASRYPAERIERQIRWIAHRNVRRNRLGMLRTAIEQDWGAPDKSRKLGQPNSADESADRESGVSFADALEKAESRFSGRLNRHMP
jgi:hypothetical protein